MKQIRNITISDNFASFQVPVGKHKGFLIHYTGTANTGETVAASDLGYVRLLVGSKEFQRIDIDRLIEINGMKGGIVDTTSNAGGSFSFTAILPQAVFGDDLNCLTVGDSDDIVLELNDFYNSTKMASGSVVVYSIPSPLGEQYYYLKLGHHDFNCVAGLTPHKVQGWENVWEMFLENDSSMDRIGIFVDGEQVGNPTREALIAYTHFINQIESWDASISYLDVLLPQTGQLTEALSDDIQLQPEFSSAGSLKTVIFAVDFAPDKLNVSQIDKQLSIQQKINRKMGNNKTRPVEVLGG